MKAGYVALVGRPNVGKSTLINSLLKEKVAIISDKPQTTRVSILGVKTTPAGQIIFIDNPGIHKPFHTLNRRMMNFVYSALETADLICLLIDATEKYGHGDEYVVETLRKVTTPLFLLINKVDIIKKEKALLIIDHYKNLLPWREIIPISALTGINLDILEEQIYKILPEAEKHYADDMVTDQTLRFQLAEIIREKLLRRVEEELPFVTAVLIDSIEEREKVKREPEPVPAEHAERAETSVASVEGGDLSSAKAVFAGTPGPDSAVRDVASRGEGAGKKDEIADLKLSRRKRGKERSKVAVLRATIFVEKNNHRKIVIGRHGKIIKEIGIEARREIEDILDARVYLDLRVKVKPRWRDSADVLNLIEGQR